MVFSVFLLRWAKARWASTVLKLDAACRQHYHFLDAVGLRVERMGGRQRQAFWGSCGSASALVGFTLHHRLRQLSRRPINRWGGAAAPPHTFGFEIDYGLMTIFAGMGGRVPARRHRRHVGAARIACKIGDIDHAACAAMLFAAMPVRNRERAGALIGGAHTRSSGGFGRKTSSSSSGSPPP